jgi:hypothetical protein
MATSDLCLQPTTVLFTQNNVSITNHIRDTISRSSESCSGYSLKEPHLRITIFPTCNSKNIGHLTVQYYNPSCIPPRLHEEIDDVNLFQCIAYSLVGHGESFCDRTRTYMQTLPSDDIATIIKEYTNYIENGMIIDGFLSGIAAYLGFLLLIENNIFSTQMPFQFSIPVTIQSGNALNRNMLQYLSLPLIALSKTTHGILLQLVTFIQSFINMWEPAFTPGPTISSINETRMCMEIMSGFTQNALQLMHETQVQNCKLQSSIHVIEDRLQENIKASISRLHREVNNLTIEARESIKEAASSHPESSGSYFQLGSQMSGHELPELPERPESTELSGSYFQLGSQMSCHEPPVSCSAKAISSSDCSSAESKRESDDDWTRYVISNYMETEGRQIIKTIVDQQTSELSNQIRQIQTQLQALSDRVDNLNLIGIPRPCPGISSIRVVNPNNEIISIPRPYNPRRTGAIDDN